MDQEQSLFSMNSGHLKSSGPAKELVQEVRVSILCGVSGLGKKKGG